MECPGCHDKFDSLSKLNKHLDRAHPVEHSVINVNDKTARFVAMREPQITRNRVIRTKLEMRFVRLATGLQSLLGDNSFSANGGEQRDYWNWREMRLAKQLEESVVSWEDDAIFERCRFCGQKFTFFRRKHHCRLCGLVMCGDLDRECSMEVPTQFLARKIEDGYPELKDVHTLFPIRVCNECKFTLLSHRSFLTDTNPSTEPLIIKLHYQLARIEREIRNILPAMIDLVAEISAHGATTPADLIVKGKSRQNELLKLCGRYDSGVRRVRALQLETEFDKRLQGQMLEKSRLFWETSIRPLKGMAQVLQTPQEARPKVNKYKAKELQEQLVVLQEQKYLLEKQIQDAKYKRHFDALEPMELSLQEIDREVNALTEKLGTFAPTH